LNESLIIEQLINGDKKSFEIIFKTYYKRLYQYALKYINDPIKADDMVQDCFFHLWVKRSQIDASKPIRNYLFIITKNKCLNWIKANNIRYQHKEIWKLSKINEQLQQLDFMKDEEESLFELMYKDLLIQIEELPEQCQKVFKLSRFDNLKNKEIANELNISIKTVEKHISKAIKQLKSNLVTFLL